MAMLNFIFLSQIMLRFDKFIHLRLEAATVKWQLQLEIVILLSVLELSMLMAIFVVLSDVEIL